ncbi:MAG: HAD family phosphatase [Acidobacteria bacterium]|nr:HAD family phosphatase [Acidobacteriota bacterium]
MNHFQGIFFDFDGVLLDTEPDHCACWAEVLRARGVELTWEYYRDHCIGIDDRDMLRVLARMADPPKEFDELWALYPEKKRLFQQRMTAPPFEAELKAMLPALAGEYRLAVVSSSASVEIEPLLLAGGIRAHFATIVGGENVKRHKPAPEPYLLAAERLGVARALVIEDSQAGIASGRAAGFEVLAVRHPREVPGALRARLERG